MFYILVKYIISLVLSTFTISELLTVYIINKSFSSLFCLLRIITHLLSDLCFNYSGASLFQSLLNGPQASLDLSQLHPQPVHGTTPLHCLSHLTEQSG